MRRYPLLAAVAVLLAATAVGPAHADECASVAVSARGEPSAFQWMAKTKARANWRAKVRRYKPLGAPYGDWNRAQDRTEVCEPTARGLSCTFSGKPCRP